MATKSRGKPRTTGPSGTSHRAQRFDDDALVRSVLAKPLLDLIADERDAETDLRKRLGAQFDARRITVRLNPEYRGGLVQAGKVIRQFVADAQRELGEKADLDTVALTRAAPGILTGKLSARVMDGLVESNEKLGHPMLYVWPRSWNVIIDVSLKFETKEPHVTPIGAEARNRDNLFNIDPRINAKRAITAFIDVSIATMPDTGQWEGIHDIKTRLSNQYVFARLGARALFNMVRLDRMTAASIAKEHAKKQARADETSLDQNRFVLDDIRYRAIHQVWPDFQLRSCVHRSVRTVKADAAQNAFGAFGDGITWAVIDSGIDWRHPHFATNGNIDPISPYHQDFSGENKPLVDIYGHGTHVAGIIAGRQGAECPLKAAPPLPYTEAGRLQSAATERKPLDEFNDEFKVVPKLENLQSIAGIAPRCKLVSLKVLDSTGLGMASNVIAAIAHIQQINGHGRDLKIHGVNISLGHEFDPLWFACGHSPLCVEVNRLVKSGVVVVVAAGNTGYGTVQSDERQRKAGLEMSINDPGNAELAITVGATHRDAPYRYGVSFFSSKGPTGDGRCKPDLVAPGERIISAAVPDSKRFAGHGDNFAYAELSGTSMAAPHVSGAIAAFLSIRREFVGEAEKVKHIFTSTATDLGRERYFQGAGMVDLLRAIQSV